MKRRNSTFCLKSPHSETQWIGFDLDMTIIRYKIKTLVHHIYGAAIRYMVEALGYPNWILEIPYSMKSLLRGVLLDKALGNFILIDSERRVQNALHGNRKLSEEEIAKAYPEKVDFMGLHTFRYWPCSSQFEIPYLYVAQQLIEHVDSGRLAYPLCKEEEKSGVETGTMPVDAPSSAAHLESLYGPYTVLELSTVVNSPYYQLMDDLHATINFNFGNYEQSYYFEPFRKSHIEDFVFDRRDLVPYLKGLHDHNIKLLLMTNSNHQYTDSLMKFAFGDDWREIFHLIVYRARKPHFFLFDAPFSRIVDPTLPGEVDGLEVVANDVPLQLHAEYYGGNWAKLKNDLFHDASVIYVGDELFGDVVAPSCYAGWETIAIVEELQEAEQQDGWKSPSTELLPPLEETAANLSIEQWGNYFYCPNGKLTFYGALMHHFADIAIPCVSRLAHFAPDQPLLPHHPHSQRHSTKDSHQKHRATVHLTESAEAELPESFRVPALENMTLTGELSKRLKEFRVVLAAPPVK